MTWSVKGPRLSKHSLVKKAGDRDFCHGKVSEFCEQRNAHFKKTTLSTPSEKFWMFKAQGVSKNQIPGRWTDIDWPLVKKRHFSTIHVIHRFDVTASNNLLLFKKQLKSWGWVKEIKVLLSLSCIFLRGFLGFSLERVGNSSTENRLTSLLESSKSLPETNSKKSPWKMDGWFRRSGFRLWDDLSFKRGRVPVQFWGGCLTKVQRRKAFIKKKHGDSLAKVEANHWPVVKKGENDSRTFGFFHFFCEASFLRFLVCLVSISY